MLQGPNKLKNYKLRWLSKPLRLAKFESLWVQVCSIVAVSGIPGTVFCFLWVFDREGVWLLCFPASTFPFCVFFVFCFFFFFLLPAYVDFGAQKLLFCTVAVLFIYCSNTVHALKNIKNGSHDTFHTFKNYFATVFSVFSFSNNKLNPNGPRVFSTILVLIPYCWIPLQYWLSSPFIMSF